MSPYLGLIPLDLLLAAAGLGLLAGIGLVRSPGAALLHAGLGLVTGWAALGIVETALVVVGAPVDWWVATIVCLALAGAGLLAARRVPARPLVTLREHGAPLAAALAGAGVLAALLVSSLVRAAVASTTLEWDAWTFWLPKAKTLLAFGGLDAGPGGFTSFPSPGYPPFAPISEATTFSFAGTANASYLPLQHWVVWAAFLWALVSLLGTRVRPAILFPFLAMLAAAPVVSDLVGSSLGDEPLMLLLGLGAVAIGLWLLEDDWRLAALAGLFLAAAGLTKPEGLLTGIAIAVLAILVTVFRRPRRAIAPALVIAAIAVALLPWRIWLHANHVPPTSDYRLSDLVDFARLGRQTDRLHYAAGFFPSHLFDPDNWLLAFPFLIVAVLLAAPRRPALSILALGSVVALPVALLLIYWVANAEIHYYVAVTIDRVPASAAVVAMALTPLLLAEAAARGAPETTAVGRRPAAAPTEGVA